MSEVVFREEKTKSGFAGFITLNRPKALNTLTHDMARAIASQLQVWQVRRDIDWVLIEAVPGKAFCAGGDIRSVFHAKQKKVNNLTSFFWDEYRLNHLIKHFSKPFIAWLDGITMGGGVGISLHGSLRIGTPNTIIAMPETAIGFFPDVGGTYMLSKIQNKVGMYLGLTGQRINALEAHQLGLIDATVTVEKDTLMQQLLDCETPAALVGVLDKYHVPANFETTLTWHDISELMSYQSFDAMTKLAFQSQSDSALFLQKALNEYAPSALQVTYEVIRRAKALSFDACLQMEYRLLYHFLQESDFYEGVRALLIDKDKSPKWNPSRLSDVTLNQIQKYFDPIQQELHYRYDS